MVKPQGLVVDVRGLGLVDPRDLELPGEPVGPGEDRALERDRVPDLPAEALGEVLADQAAGAGRLEGLVGALGQLDLGIGGREAVSVHRELREEVARVAIDPAEPLQLAGPRDAVHVLDLALVAEGQVHEEADRRLHHQAVRRRTSHAGLEGDQGGAQEAEQEHGHDQGAQGQEGPEGVAEHVLEEQGPGHG